MMATARLTADQLRAVSSVQGDLAIAAGAGTGKTTVLARRFAQGLIVGGGSSTAPLDIERVLAITFTVKAAGEIAERTRRIVADEISADAARGMDRAWISTIHGLCSRLLRRHSLEAGIEPGFALADELQASILQAEAFEAVATRLCFGSGQAAGDPDVERLFERIPFGSVREGVIAMHERARSMGLDPQRTELPTGEEYLGSLVSKAVRAASEFADACAECRQTDTVARAYESAREYTEALVGCALGEENAFIELEAIVGRLESMASPRNAHLAELKAALLDANADLARVLCGMRERASLRGTWKLLSAFSDEYASRKAARNLLDFEDLQEGVARLFEHNPGLAARYRDHFQMIMVDEFQDTNDLQMRVLSQLRDDDFCVVGDERQSIYGFRNADVRIFGQLREQITNKVDLQDNFRSHSNVLGFVNAAFSQPVLFGPGFLRLRAGRDEKPAPAVFAEKPRVQCLLVDKGKAGVAAGRAEEARRIAEEVTRLTEGGVRPGDIAILVRNSTNAPVYASAIEQVGKPVYVTAGERFFESQEVVEVLALLRTIALPFDDEALIGVLSGRFVRASNDALFALRAIAGPKGHLFEALQGVVSGEHSAALSEADIVVLRGALSRLQLLRGAQARLGLGELIYAACEAFDYDLVLFSMGAPGVRAWANVQKLVRFAEEYEDVASRALGSFVDAMRLRASEAERESMAATGSGSEAVQVMTIHASKGLEFPVVIVADLGVATARSSKAFLLGMRGAKSGEKHAGSKLEERVPIGGIRFPDSSRKLPNETLEHSRLADEAKASEVEEQKRCLYVACTRAREALLMTGTCSLEKAPGDAQLVDWVRAVLGDPQESGVVDLGGVDVAVEVVRLGESAAKPAAEAAEGPTEGQDGKGAASATARKWALAGAADAFGELSAPSRLAVGDVGGRRRVGRRPTTISYTQLHQFDACPFSHYVRFVLGLRPALEKESAAANFGSAVHALLQVASPERAAVSALDATVRRYGLDAGGRDRLSATVSGFLAGEIAKRAHSGERVVRECPVRVPLGGTSLIGSIDLLSWNGTDALIVDYKTGKAPSADSSRLPGYRLQASCYALAALRAGAENAEVVFAFVEHDGESTSFEFSRSSLDGLEGDIRTRVDAIEASDFPHLDTYSAETCAGCPALGGLCSVRVPAGLR